MAAARATTTVVKAEPVVIDVVPKYGENRMYRVLLSAADAQRVAGLLGNDELSPDPLWDALIDAL